MNHGLSDQVRTIAVERYIQPAKRSGQPRFSIAVRDLMRDLQPLGFPARNWPQICTAIQAEKFLRANGLEIEAVEGPPKKQSSTVVVRYRVKSALGGAVARDVGRGPAGEAVQESPSERALRATERIRGC